MKTILILTFLSVLFVEKTFGQSKMIVGSKHTVFVEIPKNWLPAENEQLPFFIKPNKKNVSNETYMYVYGIDYNGKPELGDWVKSNNDYISDKFEGVKIDTLNQPFENIQADNYLTGNYITITYEYPTGRNEVILVIECKSSIVTAVLSSKNKKELKSLLPAFIDLSKSIKVLGTNLKAE